MWLFFLAGARGTKVTPCRDRQSIHIYYPYSDKTSTRRQEVPGEEGIDRRCIRCSEGDGASTHTHTPGTHLLAACTRTVLFFFRGLGHNFESRL